jgi:hypothetical protein
VKILAKRTQSDTGNAFSGVLSRNERDVTILRFISDRLWRGTIKPLSMSERNPKPCLKLRNPLNSMIYLPIFLSLFLRSLKIYYSWDHVSKISHVLAMKLKSRHLEHRFSHWETNAIFRVYDTQEWNSSAPRFCWMEWFLKVMMQPCFPVCTPPSSAGAVRRQSCTSGALRHQKRLWYFIAL